MGMCKHSVTASCLSVGLALLCPFMDVHAETDPGKGDASGENEDKIDHLELAAVLISDGHFDRAELVLAEVDPTDEGLDLARYYMLAGVVALKLGNSQQAVDLLEDSIEAGQTDPLVHVFLAQALFAVERYEETIDALDDAGEVADGIEGSFLIQAQCHWRMEDRVGAWQALDEGLAKFPGAIGLMRHKVMLLMEMGLYHQALEEGESLVSHDEATAEDCVAIAEALRRGNQFHDAILVLEVARLRYPESEPVLRQMAQTYLDDGWPLTAARIMHEASMQNPDLRVDAAELYRKAGNLLLALYVNAQIVDQPVKVRQRLGILIELGRFEEAAALEDRVSRLGLLDDDAIRYAMAYILYRIGDLVGAEKYLKGILDQVHYDKSMVLLSTIEKCRASEWACE